MQIYARKRSLTCLITDTRKIAFQGVIETERDTYHSIRDVKGRQITMLLNEEKNVMILMG